MEPAIRANGGFINQYFGDGIKALFPGDSGAAGACRAAQAMTRLIAEEGEAIAGAGEEHRIGIGIHSGSIMLDTIGGQERLDTGVVGDVVNTASRIESLTKELKRPILLSETTRELIRGENLPVEEVQRVVPRGKKAAVTLSAMSRFGVA
ncbi:MAG: adenylate/guanylate cyclase domain-containing protein [Myxococcota bacterium]